MAMYSRRDKENSADYLQIRCTGPYFSLYFFHAEAGNDLKF